jgi:3-dehydroquinate dehydratase-2
MTICIINGPNLNLIGKRETDIYGTTDFDSYFNSLKEKYKNVELIYCQSNVEGELINELHAKGFSSDGIILNAGGYTHSSVAISDAIAAIKSPVIEVHISNIFAREEYRHISLLSKNCKGVICGLGLNVYELAVIYLMEMQEKKK